MTYFVQQEHTPEQCLSALDDLAGKSPQVLESMNFSCMAGEHKGYAFVEASSESEALGKVPTDLRGGSRAIKVDKFTPDQIRSFHQK
ncbi:MAG: hypothetical protein Q7R39_17410 [Dehalococcoidia bacterium]|nr:hypothetical protein [Dehalococcoidia bacterium]